MRAIPWRTRSADLVIFETPLAEHAPSARLRRRLSRLAQPKAEPVARSQHEAGSCGGWSAASAQGPQSGARLHALNEGNGALPRSMAAEATDPIAAHCWGRMIVAWSFRRARRLAARLCAACAPDHAPLGGSCPETPGRTATLGPAGLRAGRPGNGEEGRRLRPCCSVGQSAPLSLPTRHALYSTRRF